MSRTFAECRDEYEKTSQLIQELYAKQRMLQKEMQDACPHEQIVKVNHNSFRTDVKNGKNIARYRCRECFRYLTKEQLGATGEA